MMIEDQLWLLCPTCNEKFIVQKWHMKQNTITCSFCDYDHMPYQYQIVDNPYDVNGVRNDGRINYINHTTGQRIVRYIKENCDGCVSCRRDEGGTKFAWCAILKKIISLEIHERCERYNNHKNKDATGYQRRKRKIRVA